MKSRLVLAPFLVALVAAFFMLSTPALAYSSPAEMIQAEWLTPHNSEITGEMVLNVWRWYGIPPHILLTIIAAETSLGDPDLGGRLISEDSHNYGCMRAFAASSKWGMLANGTITVAGKVWFTFADMRTGMCALGRLLKVGPLSNPGYYLRCFRDNDGWCRSFAAVYYGRNVAGYSTYVRNLEQLDAKFKVVARANGWLW